LENRYFAGMNLLRAIRIGAVALSIAILMSGCERELARKSPAPDFQLTDLAGRAMSLSDQRGQVVLLGFWAVG
jgi:hypothetical protein